MFWYIFQGKGFALGLRMERVMLENKPRMPGRQFRRNVSHVEYSNYRQLIVDFFLVIHRNLRWNIIFYQLQSGLEFLNNSRKTEMSYMSADIWYLLQDKTDNKFYLAIYSTTLFLFAHTVTVSLDGLLNLALRRRHIRLFIALELVKECLEGLLR